MTYIKHNKMSKEVVDSAGNAADLIQDTPPTRTVEDSVKFALRLNCLQDILDENCDLLRDVTSTSCSTTSDYEPIIVNSVKSDITSTSSSSPAEQRENVFDAQISENRYSGLCIRSSLSWAIDDTRRFEM